MMISSHSPTIRPFLHLETEVDTRGLGIGAWSHSNTDYDTDLIDLPPIEQYEGFREPADPLLALKEARNLYVREKDKKKKKKSSHEIKNKHVDKALKVIRKTYTRETVLDKLKEREGLVKIRGSTSTKLITPIQKTIPYSAPDPYSLRPLSDIKNEAKANYRIYIEQSKMAEKSLRLVRPRSIYAKAVNKIKEEILSARNSKRFLQHNDVNGNPYDDYDHLAPSSTKSNIDRPSFSNLPSPKFRKSFSSSNIPSGHPINAEIDATAAMKSLPGQSLESGTSSRRGSLIHPHQVNGMSNDTIGHLRALHNHRNSLDTEEKKALNEMLSIHQRENARLEKEKNLQRVKQWIVIVQALKSLRTIRRRYKHRNDLIYNPLAVLSPHAKNRLGTRLPCHYSKLRYTIP